ncbi:MAG: hybrid sensor histidine kinase/response regulator [Myxococcota bacterium]
MVDPLLQRLRTGFLREAEELAQKSTRLVLELERAAPGAATAEAVEALLRLLHTLKGSAATVELDDLAQLGHALEDQVAQADVPTHGFPRWLGDALLWGLDAYLGRLRRHVGGKEGELTAIDEVLAALAARAPAADVAADVAQAAPAELPPEPVEDLAPGEPSTDEDESWRVEARHVTSMLQDIERFRQLRLRLDERRRLVSEALAQVDQLQLGLRALEVRKLLQDASRALAFDAEEASALGDSIEGAVQSISTLSLSTVLEPLHRTARDVARASGKQVKLTLVGGELTVDRKLAARLRRALVHLVRNGVDHGLELPAQRLARGKHEEGALVIRAQREGNLVVLEVADDGAGIDVQKVKEVAAQRGLPVEQLDDAGVMNLIFSPGFTTRDEVTTSSGRGVGLDVVRSELGELGGRVEVFSVPGRGTRFVLTMPGELGTTPMLAVRCEDQLLGVPLLSIEAVLAARADAVRSGAGGLRLLHEERTLPLLDLDALLGLCRPRRPEHGQPVLVLLAQGQRVAVAVDGVVGEREVVIQPLPEELRSLPAFQGAATLAGGELMLVLQPAWLTGGRHERAQAAARPRHALVIDDSLTARAMHRAVLEAGGFTVQGVATASDALRELGRHAFELVVCDLNLPELDGLAFARRLRASPQWAHLPLLIVSGRNRETDRAEALEAGADGYLTKQECVSGRLLAEVSRVLQRRAAS